MISAVIAAAGKSSRMGPPKQLLPWGGSTVLGTVVSNLDSAGVEPVVCVLGRESERIGESLRHSRAHLVENLEFATTEMVCSYQLGVTYLLETQSPSILGTLLSLGDQPQISAQMLGQILKQISQTPDHIVIPSHNMRRGHPFYMPRALWTDILALAPDETLRQVLHMNNESISYANLESDEILWDMDTPEEYEKMRDRWDSTEKS